MTVTRPFLALSIEALESIVDNADDVATLHQVKVELGFRATRAARHLEQDVAQRLAELSKVAKRSPVIPKENVKSVFTAPPPKGDPPLGPAERGREPRQRQNGASPKFTPTDEQTNAVDAFMSGGSLKISAFAGAGKTSTLKLMAHERRGQGLYLAFNKKIAEEAGREFPDGVDCRTTHSVAARSVRAQYAFQTDKMFGSIGARQLAEILGLKKWSVGVFDSLTAIQQAFLILSTVRRFSQSGDVEIELFHVPITGRLLRMGADGRDVILKRTVQDARKLWTRMLDANDGIPLGHDGYLKLWSLGAPRLDRYEYLLLDEAQDTSPVVLSVLAAQTAQVVYVGDRHQQIYEWRGAVNAMEKMQTDSETFLTQSFRFGDAIASEASGILRTLGETRQLVGNSRVSSQVVQGAAVNAVLARTNAMVFQMALLHMEKGRVPYFVGGTQELQRLVSDVFALMKGEPGSHPDFFGFTKWDEVVEFAGTEEGEELATFVNLVQKYGPSALWAAIKGSASTEEQGDITLSTVHKAKGLEWPSVYVANDFASAGKTDLPRNEADSRLFYVAITRAKETLSINPEMLASYARANWVQSSAPLKRDQVAEPRASDHNNNSKTNSGDVAAGLPRPTLAPPATTAKRRGLFGGWRS